MYPCKSKTSQVCGYVAIRYGQSVVGGFDGLLLLSAKNSGSFVWCEDTLWKAVRNALYGPVTPFGATVEHHLISAKDQSRLHQFGAKVLPIIFVGYALVAGGESGKETLWSQTVKNWRRAQKCKGSVKPQRSGSFVLTVADGIVKISGDQRRWISLTRDRPERGEKQEILQGKPDELDSPTKLQDESTRDDEEAVMTSGEFIYRHHVILRVKLYVPREETFPLPVKYVDVTRTTYTSLDVMVEKNIADYWNVDEDRELSDAWTGVL